MVVVVVAVNVVVSSFLCRYKLNGTFVCVYAWRVDWKYVTVPLLFIAFLREYSSLRLYAFSIDVRCTIFEDDEVMSFAEIIILRILFSSFCLFCFFYCRFVFCFFDSHIYMVCYKQRSKGYKAAHSIHIHAHTISHITHIPLYCMKCANTSISFIHHMKWMCVTKTTSVIRSYYPTNFYESIIH